MSEDETLSNWEQFEQFRKKITQECQSEEKHFKNKRDSYSSLEKIKKNSFHEDDLSLVNPSISHSKPPILVHPTDTDRIIKLRMENQELREKLEEIQKNQLDLNSIKESHQKQLKAQKEYYEIENNNLRAKINQFNEELEELKKVYKEKNMKLYNLVLQLEQEKQELIEKNIAHLENQSQAKTSINIHQLVDERTRVLADQIKQLEERNAKLSIEKAKIEEKYIALLNTPVGQQTNQKVKTSSIHQKSSERKPPIPNETKSIASQSFDSLPPMQKSILKNSKIQLTQSKVTLKEKENHIPTSNRQKCNETPKSSRSQVRTVSASKKQKQKKQIYSKVK